MVKEASVLELVISTLILEKSSLNMALLNHIPIHTNHLASFVMVMAFYLPLLITTITTIPLILLMLLLLLLLLFRKLLFLASLT